MIIKNGFRMPQRYNKNDMPHKQEKVIEQKDYCYQGCK